MTTKERTRVTRFAPEIDAVFEKFTDVFAEDLAGGKHLLKALDIKLNKEVASGMRGNYPTNACQPPICMEKQAAILMKELEETGIIAKCGGPGVSW